MRYNESMKKEKDKNEIPVKVDNISNEGLEADETASKNFVDGLIETFKDKGALLEAKRLIEAKDKTAELDLILNDEVHTQEYLEYQRISQLPLK